MINTNYCNTVFPHHHEEFKKSFISDDIIQLNCLSVEGFEAQIKYFENYEGDRLNNGAPAGRRLEKMNHLLDGAWYVNLKVSGESIPYFKPDNPRGYDGKIIKYEQVAGTGNGLFLANLSYSCIRDIAEKYKIRNYPKGESHELCQTGWDWIKENKSIPIGITEGAKKAMALFSIGIPCIGLTGIWNFNKSGQNKELISDFKLFKGHEFIFFYDNDSKPKTKKQVRIATNRLAKKLVVLGIAKKIFNCTWNKTSYKGIDDYLFKKNGNEENLEYEEIIFGEHPEKIKPNIYINQKYLTDENKNALPRIKEAINNHKIIGLKAPKGSGKTEAIADIVGDYQYTGTKCLVLSHRRQLMGELSRRFGIANAMNMHGNIEGKLGLALCIDSLHEKSSLRFNPENWENSIVVIDEIEQVLWHLATSKTEIGKHRKQVAENIINLLTNAKKIIVADADLSQIAVDYLEENTGEKVYLIENNYKNKEGNCQIYTQGRPHQFFWDFLEEIGKNKKVILFTASQKLQSSWSSSNIENILSTLHPEKKILRIDADTVSDPSRVEYGCANNINKYIELQKPDVILITPVLETGIDISLKYFDSYWGMNYGIVPVDSFAQAMARIREDIPRYIWSSNNQLSQIGNGVCFSSGLRLSHDKNIELLQLILQKLAYSENGIEPYTNDSLLKLWSKRGAHINSQGMELRKSVARKFTEDYKTITVNSEILNNESKDFVTEIISNTKNEAVKKYYEKVLAQKIIPNAELDELSKKKSKTEDERLSERYNKTVRRFSDTRSMDNIDSTHLQAEDEGFLPKLNFHWHLIQGSKKVAEIDKEKYNPTDFSLDFNQKMISSRILYFEVMGVLKIINSEPDEEFNNTHPLIEEVGKLIRTAILRPIKETNIKLSHLFNIRDMSDWNLCLWAINLLGFGMKGIRKIHGQRQYRLIDLCPTNRNTVFTCWDYKLTSS